MPVHPRDRIRYMADKDMNVEQFVFDPGDPNVDECLRAIRAMTGYAVVGTENGLPGIPRDACLKIREIGLQFFPTLKTETSGC